MGAWPYVKPRLDTAMRELFGQQASCSDAWHLGSCADPTLWLVGAFPLVDSLRM